MLHIRLFIKQKYIPLLVIFILLSCSGEVKKKSVPPGIIKPSQMTEIMIDIHIAEAGNEHMGLTPDSIEIYNNDLYFSIFKKHHVSKEKFIRSINFYINHPVLMEKIYEEVSNRLQVLSNEDFD